MAYDPFAIVRNQQAIMAQNNAIRKQGLNALMGGVSSFGQNLGQTVGNVVNQRRGIEQLAAQYQPELQQANQQAQAQLDSLYAPTAIDSGVSDPTTGEVITEDVIPADVLGSGVVDPVQDRANALGLLASGDVRMRDRRAAGVGMPELQGLLGRTAMDKEAADLAAQSSLDQDSKGISLLKVEDGENIYLVDRYSGEMYNQFGVKLSPSERLDYLERKRAVETAGKVEETEKVAKKRQEVETEMAKTDRKWEVVNIVRGADDVANLIDRAKSLVSPHTTGRTGAVLSEVLPQEEAATLARLLGQIRDTVTFENIAKMKAMGINLGVLTEADMEKLGSLSGSLDPLGSYELLLGNLDKIQSTVLQKADDAKLRYKEDYGIDFDMPSKAAAPTGQDLVDEWSQ